MIQPGDLLRLAIMAAGFRESQTCQCTDRVRVMNFWGYRRCWENREEISRWMAEEAAQQGIQIEPTPQAVLKMGMQILHEKRMEIPEVVLNTLGDVANEDPQLANAVREELESWDINWLAPPEIKRIVIFDHSLKELDSLFKDLAKALLSMNDSELTRKLNRAKDILSSVRWEETA